MSRVLSALARHAAINPAALALESGAQRLCYLPLLEKVTRLADFLRRRRPRVLALHADNGIDWAVADLAALAAGVPLLPLPTFFTYAQLEHAMTQAGADLLLCDRPALFAGLAFVTRAEADAAPGTDSLVAMSRACMAASLPTGTAKITYTSGSTGEPRGVCLAQEALEAVALSLQQASGAAPQDRHLAVLPLATLLENIGGLLVPMLAGATCVLPGMAGTGLSGSSGVDVPRFLHAIGASRASSLILVPQLLHLLVLALEQGAPRPPALRHVAVGGAPVSPTLLARAAAVGLPVFEGYGLSECASVVSLNRAGALRPGSVGRVLPHAEVAIAGDGEIQVRGAGLLGYVDGPAHRDADGWLATGDIGHVDADGYLHLEGRKKNMFITAYGRNVAPEWVERELTAQPAIAQAAVFGEGRPFNAAVLVLRPEVSAGAAEAAVQAANRQLPDYARVTRWLPAAAPFSAANGQATANGRLRRGPIAQRYAQALQQLYCEDTHGLLR